MGGECCKIPCPGLDLSRTDGNGIGQRFNINREQFTRKKFLIGDNSLAPPNGLQNPAFQDDSANNPQKGKSNGWERPALTVPTEAVVAAIAAAEAAAPATPPVPPPRSKRNRKRQAPPPAPGVAQPVPLADDSKVTPQLDTSEAHQEPEATTDPTVPTSPTTPTAPTAPTLVENVLASEVQLPSVDENSVLNCSNTVDLLRTVMQRQHEDYPVAPPKKKTQNAEIRKGSSVSLPGDDVLAKTVQEKSLSKFKFSANEKRDLDLSTAGTEEDERELLKSRIKGGADTRDDDDLSSSDEEEDEDEDGDNPIRRSSASSGTLEPYDTACSGDEAPHETKEEDDAMAVPPTPENSPRHGSLDEVTAPHTTLPLPRRSMSENDETIARSLSPTLSPVSLAKSAMLLTPRQWKPAGVSRSNVTTPEPDSVPEPEMSSAPAADNIPHVQLTREPSEHQINTRHAMTSFIMGTYQPIPLSSLAVQANGRPSSPASSHAGSLGELEDDIYKLLSESKDEQYEDDDDLPPPAYTKEAIPVSQKAAYQSAAVKEVAPPSAPARGTATNEAAPSAAATKEAAHTDAPVHDAGARDADHHSATTQDVADHSVAPHNPEVPILSSAELVRKQQELYIQSMREIRSENGREQ